MLRFTFFPFLSGAYSQFMQSRCPHCFFVNWHSALRDKSENLLKQIIRTHLYNNFSTPVYGAFHYSRPAGTLHYADADL